MCSPCGPMVCYKYEDCGPPKSGNRTTDDEGSDEEDEQEKKKNKLYLKRVKSRELRGGILYTGCDCIKRNGLQHDCRRTGCQGEPPCLLLPDPVCLPSQLMRARGLADPAPLAKHFQAVADAAGKGGSAIGGGIKALTDGPSGGGGGGGRKFIVCELTGTLPGMEVKTSASRNDCKCKTDSKQSGNPPQQMMILRLA